VKFLENLKVIGYTLCSYERSYIMEARMKFVNVRELKNKTSAVLHYTENGKDVIVTSRGKPCAVIHHLSEDEIEDYILLNHPQFKKRLKKSLEEYASGEIVGIDKLIHQAEKDLGRI